MRPKWVSRCSETEHLGFLLRVQFTHTPFRWRWYVIEQKAVTKMARNSPARASSAHGLSATFENAQRDAEKMAEAMKKQGMTNA